MSLRLRLEGRYYNPPRVYSCIVACCETVGHIGLFCHLPKDPVTRKKWISDLPPLGTKKFNEHSVLCWRHFTSMNGRNDKKKVRRAKPLENLVLYTPKSMFMLPERDIAPDTFGDCEGMELLDFIIDYSFLQLNYRKMLGDFLKVCQVKVLGDTTMFYTVKPNSTKFMCLIKINKYLRVEIILGNRKVDPLDLTWILPVSSRITRWSQLKMLLYKFGSFNVIRIH
uniref:Uncharacterized protein LOC114326969 isoform X2 n=1 Tax=Diabrotica virgifera virgifera TaxID=50390 RepID=A0A6P7F688_DIAVI